MSSLSKQKKDLRETMKNRLDAIPFFSLIEKTDHLRTHFFQQIVQPNLQHLSQRYVVSFYPFASEPQINIENELQNEPYQIGYVRIDDWSGRRMSASAARRDQPGQWEEIEPSPGVKIFQPHQGQVACHEHQMAVILVPGLAFSKNAERLGRGAGFYDRFLEKNPSCLRVGLAFSEQIIDPLPHEDFDQSLDIILTDQAIFPTNRFGEWKKHGKILNRNS